jgi:thiamine-monophosphate kinase
MSVESRRVRLILEALRRHPAMPMAGLVARIDATQRDDCAVVPIGDHHDLVIGSDFVRGEGFALYKQGLLTRQEIGAYLVGANTSDIAAMGAAPLGMTFIYRYPDTTTDDEFAAIVEGVVSACERFAIPLVGGDTGSYESSVLAATAFGICPRGRALLRSGGRDGDYLYLTGDVGRALSAFRYFPAAAAAKRPRLPEDMEAELLAPWQRVEPAVAQGRLLVQEELSRCAMDTSDGVFAAAELLAEASQVDVVLDQIAMPVRDSVKRAADYLGADWVELACGASVDFRLLFSAPAEVDRRLREGFARREWPLYRIGRMTTASGTAPTAYLQATDGRRRALQDCW